MENRDHSVLAFYWVVCEKIKILTAPTYSYFYTEAY